MKEKEYQILTAEYTDRFTQQPVITIQLIDMHIGFNPNKLFDLGEQGRVYPTAEVKDAGWSVEVNEGGMLMKDWKVIYLPVNKNLIQTAL